MNKLSEQEVINNSISFLDRLEESNSNTVWVIKYNNKLLKLYSGKSSWKKQHHAISAFHNAIGCYMYNTGDWSINKITKLLIKEGIIKIEQLV